MTDGQDPLRELIREEVRAMLDDDELGLYIRTVVASALRHAGLEEMLQHSLGLRRGH